MAQKYVFDPEVVHECAMKCIGLPKPRMFDVFGEAMEERYPQLLDHAQPWVYSIAGGSLIQMKLFYASMTEYVMIWGTPIGSEGLSGRHMAGFWDTFVDGEAKYYGEGQFEAAVYKPGDRVYVGPGQARAMNFNGQGAWAVEYARGFIPYSFPFGFADVLLSAADWVTAVQTLTLYADLNMQSLSHKVPALKTPLSLLAGLARTATFKLIPPAEVQGIPKDNIKFFGK